MFNNLREELCPTCDGKKLTGEKEFSPCSDAFHGRNLVEEHAAHGRLYFSGADCLCPVCVKNRAKEAEGA